MKQRGRLAGRTPWPFHLAMHVRAYFGRAARIPFLKLRNPGHGCRLIAFKRFGINVSSGPAKYRG